MSATAAGQFADEEAAVSLNESDDGDRDYVASLARGLEVICAFTRDTPSMTLSDVAKVTGMSRATTRRLLLTLVREGYAEKRDRHFSLRPKVLQLGYSALSSVGILDIVQPVMNALSQKTQESIYTAVLTGDDVTYLARSTPDRVISVNFNIGNRLPAYAVSTGRVLLAGESDETLERYFKRLVLEEHTSNTVRTVKQLRAVIAEVRDLGYSLVDEELEVGVRSLSVPIYDAGGHVIAALNACCPSMRFPVEDMRQQLVPELRAAAQSINERFQQQ
ncbi:IclR family transcriptional regulator domain-containing protein [Sphingomonas dokdonensis]|uniref:Pca regulon regulatory protein n=1 Tax=Sphingomonas dokdonensis TaxID=344880 RepID=A0A245ZIE1_9SPHN|nr:IclR family transcriptional regulator C-terminal domain-containing protein [Sphingomonas dokdonensis]OWK29505.1 Pca regulon regulatory protein [Sphingomonas dokdonensis]